VFACHSLHNQSFFYIPVYTMRGLPVLLLIASRSVAAFTATAAAQPRAATKPALSISLHSDSDSTPATPVKKSQLSSPAQWHQNRRKLMIEKYDDILRLEQQTSQWVGIPLLITGNLALVALSILAGSLPLPAVFGLALVPGSILSLWQLQILHDCLHGTLLERGPQRKVWQERILFWGSLPCVFGYYLYLQYGHLTHHKNVGGESSLLQLFDSSQTNFEDGDILFVSHRMNLKGEIGPQIPLGEKRLPLSISRTGFHFWRPNQPILNAMMFASSFLFERYMLCWNDVVVAVTGRNFFFPNKPDEFHQKCAAYTRCAVALRLALFTVGGWKALIFLYLSETLWSIPPHPACAMFITNHGSKGGDEECMPSASTYAGRWYSILTLGTNYHCEHHDFPSIPFHLLGRLHKIAPEFYTANRQKDSVFTIMKSTFANPDFYACSNANQLKDYT
jgi:fatty acid desaturase